MTVPITFQVHQMLARQPMSPKELRQSCGLTSGQIYGALAQLVKTGQVVRQSAARQGYVYKVNA